MSKRLGRKSIVYDARKLKTLTRAPSGAAVNEQLDHGALLGLADDDHTQYLLADGTRVMTGNLTLDDGVGNSPSVQFVGGSNDDTASIFLRDDADAGESDLCVDLCSDVIASRFIIRNQSGTTIAWISATGRMGIVDRLTDENDQDSYIDIGGTDDAMTFVCGGVTMLDFVEDDAQDKVVVNDGGADVDTIVEASGVADALVVQGSDGQITLGALGAGVVQSTAGGVLSSATILGIENLSDPGADRILFWDNSETALGWLIPADEFVISTTNISVDHDACTNFVANEHIDHTSVSISAGTGLTGGGDISANRTISLSHLGIQSLSDPGADRMMFWDDSDSAVEWLAPGTGLSISDNDLNCSITDWSTEALQDLVGAMVTGNTETLIAVTYQDDDGTLDFVVAEASINHDALTNFVTDEHVAHSGVTLTAGDGLTGGGTIAASRTFAVGAGNGISVAVDSVAIDLTYNFAWTGVHTFTNTGLHILDTNASHDLIVKPGSDLTADRTLTLTTGDVNRTITLNGNPTLSDWFDQAVKQASTPTFAALTLTGDLTMPDDGLIGLSGGGYIAFDNQATDEINFMSCRVGIGDDAPDQHLSIASSEDQTTLGNNTGAAVRIINTYTAAYGRRSELQFGVSGTQQSNLLAIVAAEYTSYDATYGTGGELIFGTKTATDAAITEGMRLYSNRASGRGVGYAGSFYGESVNASGSYATAGDAQRRVVTLRDSITHSDNSWHSLYLDGSSAMLDIPTDTVWRFTAHVIAARAGLGNTGSWQSVGVIENDGGTVAITYGGTATEELDDDGSLEVQTIADDTNNRLLVQVRDTDGTSLTYRWFCTMTISQLQFPA